MIGAIAGDIIGSLYEHNSIKSKEFQLFHPECCFTDDSVLTIAVAKAIMEKSDYGKALQEMGRKYPYAGYGRSFIDWIHSDDPKPYNSWGNGSAMRVSPVGFVFTSVDRVLKEAAATAVVSHNHIEGVKGARATALAVYLARQTKDKELIRKEITKLFGYNLDRDVNTIRYRYCFDVSCQGSVPEAIISFLDSESYEDAVRNAVSLGGDSDTLACIAGGIAEAFYGGVPKEIKKKVREYLTPELWDITEKFYSEFMRDSL